MYKDIYLESKKVFFWQASRATALTHGEFRKMVCYLCLEKMQKKNQKQIVNGGALLKLIQQNPQHKNYSPNDPSLPTGCCSTCYNKVQRKKPLPNPDYNLKFPIKPSMTRRGNIDSNQHCACSICEIGRENPSQSDYNFTKKKYSAPKKKPGRRCEKCLGLIGRYLYIVFYIVF